MPPCAVVSRHGRPEPVVALPSGLYLDPLSDTVDVRRQTSALPGGPDQQHHGPETHP